MRFAVASVHISHFSLVVHVPVSIECVDARAIHAAELWKLREQCTLLQLDVTQRALCVFTLRDRSQTDGFVRRTETHELLIGSEGDACGAGVTWRG